MNEINTQIENIFDEEIKSINHKITGVLFLELLKFKLIDRIFNILSEKNLKILSSSKFEFKKIIEEKIINVRLVLTKNGISLINQNIDKSTLFLSIDGILNLGILLNKEKKIFNNLSILPKMGICLPTNTIINLKLNKNKSYFEITMLEKLDIENKKNYTI
ncbi:MAG: hypothetical protein CMI96_01930 [Pelagibacteraceae bacterium]|nr:hypothetical protein [Pelagibacteraceae bacterium]|tara:strand:- start:9793 stop:10275 length:483 start_codon:yes stop_codon:yes gene_type:complete